MSARWKSRTPWREKLLRPQEPRVVETPPAMRRPGHPFRMLISTPRHVDALVRQVKKGKLITPALIRERLAADAGVEEACAMTTGIFIRIVAEAAQEALEEGKARVTPYWRVVQTDGRLYEKFPGGAQAQAERLRAEGHEVEPAQGKRPPKVKGFEAKLQPL